MAGVKFLSENHFDNATLSLTTGTANAQFPLANLQNDSPSVKFRSTGVTAVVEIDLLTARDIDVVAIAGDPVGTLGVSTATFKTSATTDFTLSPVNTIDLSSEEGIGYKFITEVNHRYVELTLTAASFVELGKVFVGKAIDISNNGLAIGSFAYGRVDRSRIRQNRYGQKFIDALNKQKRIGGTIEYANQAEQSTLDDMFIRHGQSLPLWMIVDENAAAITEGDFKLTIYGYLEQDPSWSASGGQTYNASIDIRQAI